MSTRKEAEAAIHLWRRLGLLQKVLAFRAGVSASAVSKIVHEPGYTRCEDVYRRIRDVVQREFTTRIDSLPLTVLTMCEDRPRTFDTGTTAAVVARVKDKLHHLGAPGAVTMPQGIGGAILRIGTEEGKSGLFLIAVPEGGDNRKIAAFIHELDHFKNYLTRGFRRDYRPPRSAY